MMKCRHHLDPDACELCQEHIREVAARLGRSGGEARRLALSAERRAEIARIAAQRRWHDVIWSDMQIKPHVRPRTPRHRELPKRARYVHANSKNNQIREILKANPERRTNDVAREVGAFPSVVSNIRRELGLPRQTRQHEPKPEITERDLAEDQTKLAAMRRIVAYVAQGYKIGRIAQLLDLPVNTVRAFLEARETVRLGRLRRKTERPMTPADVEAAYALWKEGKTYRTIAHELNFSDRQIQSALRKELRARGDK